MPDARSDLTQFASLMQSQGWAMFESVIPPDQLAELRVAVLDSVDACGRRQVASGATSTPDGTAHHSVGQFAAFDRFLEQHWLADAIRTYFGGAPTILHAFNPASVMPQQSSYLHCVHRDVRTHAGDFHLLLNMLVMVDSFTLENGATHVLSGSHRSPMQPPEALFRAQSTRLTGPPGSIVLFDSNLWHAAGENMSGLDRTALTLSYSRAFVKQQMDYPRFLGAEYGQGLSPSMRQLLGYNAMVPCSYDEFYRPVENRLYQGDQG